MPTPIGHCLIGLAVGEFYSKRKPGEKHAWITSLYFTAVACMADLDFISWDGDGLNISSLGHHGITHSLGFAVIASALAGAVAVFLDSPNWFRLSFLTGLAYTSHIMADIICVDEFPQNGIGLPALWPLSGDYYIIPLLPGVDRSHVFTMANAVNLSLEIALFGGVYLAAQWLMKAKNPQRQFQ
ncbi:MAG: metal-dependent hydrolase [Nitrospinae bacterium]|nr:metal-dependent hydrolase [Nitrospinota bacterium]